MPKKTVASNRFSKIGIVTIVGMSVLTYASPGWSIGTRTPLKVSQEQCLKAAEDAAKNQKLEKIKRVGTDEVEAFDTSTTPNVEFIIRCRSTGSSESTATITAVGTNSNTQKLLNDLTTQVTTLASASGGTTASNTGTSSTPSNTGTSSTASNTGTSSTASNTGTSSTASNTGTSSTASNTGTSSTASNTGTSSTASNTGTGLTATNTSRRTPLTPDIENHEDGDTFSPDNFVLRGKTSPGAFVEVKLTYTKQAPNQQQRSGLGAAVSSFIGVLLSGKPSSAQQPTRDTVWSGNTTADAKGDFSITVPKGKIPTTVPNNTVFTVRSTASFSSGSKPSGASILNLTLKR